MKLSHRGFSPDEKKMFSKLLLSEMPNRGIISDNGQFFYYDKYDLISTQLNQQNTFKIEQAAMLYNNLLFGIEYDIINNDGKILWGYTINCPENFADYNLTESDIADAVKDVLVYKSDNSANKQIGADYTFEYRGIKLLPVIKPGEPGSGKMRVVFNETAGNHKITIYQSDMSAIYGGDTNGGVTHIVYLNGQHEEFYSAGDLEPAQLPIEDCFHVDYKTDDEFSLLFDDKKFNHPRFIGGRKIIKRFIAPDSLQTATISLTKEYYNFEGTYTLQLLTKLSDGTEARASIYPKDESYDSLNINCKWLLDGGCCVTCDSKLFSSPQQIGGMVHLSSTKLRSGAIVNVSKQSEFKAPSGISGIYKTFNLICVSANVRKSSEFTKNSTLIETIDEPFLIKFSPKKYGVDIYFYYKSKRMDTTLYEFYECEIPQRFVNNKAKVEGKQDGGIEVIARTKHPSPDTNVGLIQLTVTYYNGATGRAYIFKEPIRFKDIIKYDVKFKDGNVIFKAISAETKQCVIEDSHSSSTYSPPIKWL
jgi:hypothetical protein